MLFPDEGRIFKSNKVRSAIYNILKHILKLEKKPLPLAFMLNLEKSFIGSALFFFFGDAYPFSRLFRTVGGAQGEKLFSV